MKTISIYILALLPLIGMAQVNRTQAPKPGVAPTIKIGTPATFILPNGLKVFVVENNKLPRVSASLTIDIDGIVEGDKTGLTSLAGSLMRRGTTTMDKVKLDEEIDFLGGSVNTSAFNASAFSLKNNFTKVFSLMSNVVLNPSLPAAELEKIRKKELSNLKQGEDDPNEISDNVSNHLVYGNGHPYGDIETEETVNNIKLEDIKSFFKTYWIPNNAYLVFVGNITTLEAKKLATTYFGSWKKGVVTKPVYKTPQPPAKTYIAIVDRPASVQSLISMVTPIQLRPGTPDAIPGSVMNNILGGGSSGRLFQNLREKHGFTYGAYSQLKADRLIGAFSGGASVRNEKTDSAIAEFLSEFNMMRDKPIADSDVVNSKNFLSGTFARSLENPATIARFALDISRNKMPSDYYQNYLKNLGSVSTQNVHDVASKYVLTNQMYIVIVGNAKEIAAGLEKYGEVKYYDVHGKEVAAPVPARSVDAGVTAVSILKKAVAAIGAPAAIAAIKDVILNGEAPLMGRTLEVSQKNILPNIFVSELLMGGMAMQKQMLKEGKYTMIERGQEQQPDAEEKEELDEKAAFFDDVFLMSQKGNDYTVTGIEKVDDKDAYVMQVKTAAGREFTNYYDVETGLKVKSSKMEDAGAAGKITIQTYLKGYKTFNGVQIPTNVIVDQGQFKIDINFKDIKVNSGLKADDIK